MAISTSRVLINKLEYDRLKDDPVSMKELVLQKVRVLGMPVNAQGAWGFRVEHNTIGYWLVWERQQSCD